MKKILGLDLGVASIGWAYVLWDEKEDGEILGMGTRVVPLSRDERDAFTKGQPVPTNTERAKKKGMRRNKERYLLRRAVLSTTLRDWGWLPCDELFALEAVELYGLRDRALKEKISLQELGRIFFHLNQKRGFKSNRKADVAEEKLSNYKEKIEKLSHDIRAQGKTPGQYFYEKLLKDNHYCVKKQILYRADYEGEFDRIWEAQKAFHPAEMTDERRKTVRDRIIYYQRRLKSQKKLVGKCRFEQEYRCAPQSSPLSQVCKIWEAVNNVAFTSPMGEKLLLTEKQRIELFNALYEKDKLSESAIMKIAQLKSSDNYKSNYEDGLKGNLTYVIFKKAFDKAGIKNLDLLKFNALAEDIQKEPLYELWHLVYAAEQDIALIAKLQERYGFSAEQAKTVAGVGFNADRAGKSSRAMRNIMPYLVKGLKYSEACAQYAKEHLQAGTPKYQEYANHSDSETLEQKHARELKSRLDPIVKNSLRSPVAEKILYQMVHVVNALIDKHGAPDEIHVELARELKESAKNRQSMTKGLQDTERLYEKYRQLLLENKELRLSRITKKDLIKYRLWMEFGEASPYEPKKKISLAELFSPESEYEIEHIIPRSRYFDDSFANKTLAKRRLNQEKDNLTAYDFMATRKDFADYIGIVNDKATKISNQKRRYLLMKGDEIPQDFLNRDLALTRYITKKAKTMMEDICRDVIVSTGSITEKLRHRWGLDDLLMELNLEKLEKLGVVEEITDKHGKRHKTSKDWTKRDDHRHHAIDALLVAFTTRGLIQTFNLLNQEHEDLRLRNKSPYDIPPPFKHFRATVKEATASILVSFKGGKKSVSKAKKGGKTPEKHLIPRGPLHKETVYGRIKYILPDPVPLDKSFKKLDFMVNQHHRALVAARLEAHGMKAAKAFEEPIWLDEAQTKPLTRVRVWEYRFTTTTELTDKFDPKRLTEIVSPQIRNLVWEHLRAHGNDPKKAFAEGNTLWLNPDRKIPVRKVTIFAKADELQPLHTNHKGEDIDYVFTRNNHHTAVYRNEAGELKSEVVSLWEAVARRKHNMPAVATTHPEKGWPLVGYFQENEMFVFGMALDELKDAISQNNKKLISKHLYRVQKMAEADFVFRHHLETKVSQDDSLAKEAGIFHRLKSDSKLQGLVKVRLNHIGDIVYLEPF